jgi:hypothetical protein
MGAGSIPAPAFGGGSGGALPVESFNQPKHGASAPAPKLPLGYFIDRLHEPARAAAQDDLLGLFLLHTAPSKMNLRFRQ